MLVWGPVIAVKKEKYSTTGYRIGKFSVIFTLYTLSRGSIVSCRNQSNAVNPKFTEEYIPSWQRRSDH